MSAIYTWDAGAESMCYLWRGKLWLLPHPMALQWVRVRAEDYVDITISFYADGLLLQTNTVTSNRAFRLAVRRDYSEIDYEIIGRSRIRSVEIADDVMEID